MRTRAAISRTLPGAALLGISPPDAPGRRPDDPPKVTDPHDPAGRPEDARALAALVGSITGAYNEGEARTVAERFPEDAETIRGRDSIASRSNETLLGVDPDVDTYTAQLRALEHAVRAKSDAAAPRFVLAYLYLTSGQNADAESQLKAVVALQRKDRISAQILQLLAKDQPSAAAPDPIAEPAVAPASVEPAPGKIEGTWTAIPVAGTTITLGLAGDGDFTWKVATDGQSHQLAGRSTSEAGILTLVPTEGGSPMVGQCKWQDGDHFTHAALGGGPGDPGLGFAGSPR